MESVKSAAIFDTVLFILTQVVALVTAYGASINPRYIGTVGTGETSGTGFNLSGFVGTEQDLKQRAYYYYGYGTRSVPTTMRTALGVVILPDGYGTRSVPITMDGIRSSHTTRWLRHAERAYYYGRHTGYAYYYRMRGMNRWLMHYHLLHIQI